MKLGAIGDDFTGSSDLGLMLAEGGMKTVQYVGVPNGPATADVEAGIVALKTRSVPPQDAVSQSLDALKWLRAQGCEQFLFKVCSTFDSTPEGNIGPVIDALIDALGTTAPVIVCPAFPATGRTLFQGHLFVGDRLLSESGLENHPITPMTDPDIRRWLGRQTKRSVGLLAHARVRAGAVRQELLDLAATGSQIIVCDAVEDGDLHLLGEAAKGFDLIAGGSGIGIGLPALHGADKTARAAWTGEDGRALALSGSCSRATRAQIAEHAAAGSAQLKVDVAQLIDGSFTADDALDWAGRQTGLPLIYTSDDPEQVKAIQEQFGGDRAAETVETFFGDVATKAVAAGVSRLISAGGETSGAIVKAIGADILEIGPMIDPGVPAVRVGGQKLVLALKSGNFGAPDFFHKAQRIMGPEGSGPESGSAV